MWGEEPHPELFDLLRDTLAALRGAPPASLLPITLAFELKAAALLGYRPRLGACVLCGAALSPRRLFSGARGGMLCDGCARGESGVVALSADGLAALALLLDRPLDQAVGLVEVRRAGELLRVTEDFLRAHFQRFAGLKSLEVLRALPGGLNGEVGPCD